MYKGKRANNKTTKGEKKTRELVLDFYTPYDILMTRNCLSFSENRPIRAFLACETNQGIK